MTTHKLNYYFNTPIIPYRYIQIDLSECAEFSRLFSKEIREHETQNMVIDISQIIKNCIQANEFSNTQKL